MSGIAIIVNNADYSGKLLGVVTPTDLDIPLVSIAISGTDVLASKSHQYIVEYTPANTTEKGVIWSVEIGSEYVTIDQAGVLTVIGEITADTNVRIKAVSSINPSVYAVKDITLKYSNEVLKYNWQFGFWSSDKFYTEETSSGARKYASFTPMLEITQPLSIRFADGFYGRLIVATSETGTGMYRTDFVTEIQNSYETAKSLNASATHYAIVVSHNDVVSPSQGTDLTDDELANIANIVTVTPLKTQIEIVGNTAPVGIESQYNVTKLPSTAEVNLVWCITSGSQYGSIDQNGLLTIDESANNSAITIEVTDSLSGSIATLDIVATYSKSYTYTEADCTLSGYGVKATTGEVLSGWDLWSSTPNFMPADKTKIKITANLTAGSFGIAFYDNNEAFISGIVYATQNGLVSDVPSNATYIKFCVMGGYAVTIELYDE